MNEEGLCEINVNCEDWAHIDPAGIARRACEATRSNVEGVAWPVSILFTDDTEIARLNGQFRGRDGSTNVLSFPYAPTPGEEFSYLGDVAIAYGTCAREARERTIALSNHTAHMIIHGILHLLGFDHETDSDAEIMETKEIAILSKLNIDNPYREIMENEP